MRKQECGYKIKDSREVGLMTTVEVAHQNTKECMHSRVLAYHSLASFLYADLIWLSEAERLTPNTLYKSSPDFAAERRRSRMKTEENDTIFSN